MEIREVLPREFDEAGRLTALAYAEFADPDDPGWREYLGLLADVRGRAGRTIVLVAVSGGRVLGTATIEMDATIGDDDEVLSPDVACLRMLGVDPEARGQGLGRALVEACIERCRERGKRELILRTTDPMVTAQRLYSAMGFERAEDLDQLADDELMLRGYRLAL
jgi:GNAT superfamily N-acetyltransferase